MRLFFSTHYYNKSSSISKKAIHIMIYSAFLICLGCKDGLMTCLGERDQGVIQWGITKFNSDEYYPNNVCIYKYPDGPEYPSDSIVSPINGQSPSLHKGYFVGYYYDTVYVLSLTYNNIINLDKNWINQWRNYIIDSLVVEKVYETSVSRCKHSNNYYKYLPFCLEKDDGDILFIINDSKPFIYISKTILNQMIDNGSLHTYFY